ncbi:hypothetical protein HK102_002429 [Quaeritorhiza haematococci]|nr:hypothetical protein HK102_002429 [Quaeritorhiza haematococci]
MARRQKFPSVIRSCPVLYLHFFWGIFCIFVGILALTARFVPRLTPYHKAIGRVYFYGMMVQMYTALWAHDDGFPWYVFTFGLLDIFAMISGHLFISTYRSQLAADAVAAAALARTHYPMPMARDDEKDAGEMGAVGAASMPVPTHPVGPTGPGTPAPARRFGGANWYKVMHGICMGLSLLMTFSAGVFFLRRYSLKPKCIGEVKWYLI